MVWRGGSYLLPLHVGGDCQGSLVKLSEGMRLHLPHQRDRKEERRKEIPQMGRRGEEVRSQTQFCPLSGLSIEAS